jgi:hypothetical protein
MTAGPGFPRFRGSFRTFRVTVSTNREKGTKENFLVYSQGSRGAVQKYLWYKFLWDELTKQEMELFLIMPETISDPLKFGALRALLILGKRKVRDRIVTAPFLEERDKPRREKYQGIKGLRIEISRETRKLPKVPKFSGWIRSSSAIGSKRPGGPSFLEPLAIREDDYSEFSFDWYSYLTVGESYLQNSAGIRSRPDELKRAKRFP